MQNSNLSFRYFPLSHFKNGNIFLSKHLSRKNYKDLDRQVESFLQEEMSAKEKYTDTSIHIGDWINYSLTLLNNDNNPVFDNQASKSLD